MSSIADRINMIIVAMPFPHTGGGYRALLSIKEYVKRGINPLLILPWKFRLTTQEKKEDLSFLLKEGIKVYGDALLPWIFPSHLPFKRSLTNLLVSKHFSLIKIRFKENFIYKPHCVMTMHEGVDSITTCLRISEILSLKRIALLQLPPFYEDQQRVKNIEEAYRSWLEIIGGFKMNIPRIIVRWLEKSTSKNMKQLLNSFDLILAVSKSIPMEMGREWSNKIITLDPGVGLSQEDIQLINDLSKRIRDKEKIVVFGGRPSPEKGIVEALIVFKNVVKNIGRDYKLAITGNISAEIREKIKIFCNKLGIEDNIIFYGFLPREERLSIVAKSKVMLYPSHVDAFPYAILESLYLNTPVVAYDIPALRIYYNDIEGVILVKESDIETLTSKTIETINNKNIHIEKPKFIKNWDKIMDKEVKIIKTLFEI